MQQSSPVACLTPKPKPLNPNTQIRLLIKRRRDGGTPAALLRLALPLPLLPLLLPALRLFIVQRHHACECQQLLVLLALILAAAAAAQAAALGRWPGHRAGAPRPASGPLARAPPPAGPHAAPVPRADLEAGQGGAQPQVERQ